MEIRAVNGYPDTQLAAGMVKVAGKDNASTPN